MKKLLCVLGCFILLGSNLVFADNNENRTALEFHKPEAANFNNFEDGYRKREEGDEVFGDEGFNLRMFDKNGAIIYQAPYVFTVNDEPIPDEYYDKASEYFTSKKGKTVTVKKMKYNNTSYAKGQAFVKDTMLYRDIDIIALDQIILWENGSLVGSEYISSKNLNCNDPYINFQNFSPNDFDKFTIKFSVSFSNPYNYEPVQTFLGEVFSRTWSGTYTIEKAASAVTNCRWDGYAIHCTSGCREQNWNGSQNITIIDMRYE